MQNVQATHESTEVSLWISVGKFLGFLVHHGGISVNPAKATTIATMKRPIMVKELKSFVGSFLALVTSGLSNC